MNKDFDLLSQHLLPRIELGVKPESARIRLGEEAVLRWSAETAQQLYLIEGPPGIPRMTGPTVVRWDELEQVGRRIDLKGTLKVRPKSTTAYVFAARGKKGRYRASIIIDVVAKEVELPAAHTWSSPDDPFDPDELPPDFYDRDRELWEAIRCALVGPRIKFTADPNCLYKDQETTLEWNASCSTYAELYGDTFVQILETDLTQRSGTRLTGFEGGGFIEPFLPRRAERRYSGEFFGSKPGCQKRWAIFAGDDRGRHANAEVMAGFLPHPIFDGCSDPRQGEIETALVDIYCCLLLEECLVQNRELDHRIDAFRRGHLNRVRVWMDLIAQLENLQLFTFQCRNTTDADWEGGRWAEYTNEMELQWSPSHRPNLFYVILHELIHKVGFNGDLLAHYTEAEIEDQARAVTEVTMRCCQREVPAGGGKPS